MWLLSPCVWDALQDGASAQVSDTVAKYKQLQPVLDELIAKVNTPDDAVAAVPDLPLQHRGQLSCT